MAVTAFATGFKLTSVNDILNQATVGHPNTPSPYRVLVNAITFQRGAATGVTTVRSGGLSGTIIYSGTPIVNDTAQLSFGTPQNFDDLCVTAIGTNVTVLVQVK